MSNLERWLAFLLVLLLGILLGQRHQPPEPLKTMNLQRGINFVAYEPEQYRLPSIEEDLKHLKSLGVNWVAVVVTWYQSELSSTVIAPVPERSAEDEDVVKLLRYLHKLEMNAFLRPMVDVSDGHWRGEIEFSSEADWAAWFQSYEAFLMHYAELAAREGVGLFSVGVELEGTVQQEREWRQLIGRVRRVFAGPLLYSANWDGFQNVPFWDALDYVGIDAYFELDTDPDSELTPDVLAAAWSPWVEPLEAFAAGVSQPIVFTEIGARSVQGASRRPWDWLREAPISLEEQANYYEAAFQVFWGRPWLAGLYWWAWLPDPKRGGADDDGYSPRGKPAEEILKSWYSG